MGKVYNELILNPLYAQSHFHNICYDYFLANYGLKKISEKNLIKFYECVYFFKNQNPRIYLFGRLIGLYDKFQSEYIHFYVETIFETLFLKKEDAQISLISSNDFELVEISRCIPKL